MHSMNPADIIPVGTATIPIPNIAIIALKILPTVVIGYISPYPTMVRVAIDHHKPENAFSNLSGCAVPSTLYIKTEAIIISRSTTNIEDKSGAAFFLKINAIDDKAVVYLFILNSLKILKTRKRRKTRKSMGKIYGKYNGSIAKKSMIAIKENMYLSRELNGEIFL